MMLVGYRQCFSLFNKKYVHAFFMRSVNVLPLLSVKRKASTSLADFSEAHCCMEDVCWPVYVGRFPVTHLSNFLSTS